MKFLLLGNGKSIKSIIKFINYNKDEYIQAVFDFEYKSKYKLIDENLLELTNIDYVIKSPGISETNQIYLKLKQKFKFINELDLKYETNVGEAGGLLSGGQKQRLSIARAICKNPDIFVFDDAFSALDMKTDAKLRAALKEVTAEAVVLIVAQRVSTIKDADQIVVLNNGKVMGKGRHLELLRSCKVYQEIVKSQLSDAEYARELKLAEKYDAKVESKRAASQEDVIESAGKSSLERGSYAAA